MYYYLNFSDLNEDAQNEIREVAKSRLDLDELRKEAVDNDWDYDEYLSNEIDRELMLIDFVFNI